MIELYQSSLQNRTTGEYEVRLQTLPCSSAELISLCCIPYNSRHNAQNKKPLLEYYRNMLNKPSMERPPDPNKLRKEHLETGIMEFTVIAQVLVRCQKIFYVKDLATGKGLGYTVRVTNPLMTIFHGANHDFMAAGKSLIPRYYDRCLLCPLSNSLDGPTWTFFSRNLFLSDPIRLWDIVKETQQLASKGHLVGMTASCSWTASCP
jgi:hypothetical protein